jgi:hypothetical protein
MSEVAFQKGGGRAWALYKHPDCAQRTVHKLHQSIFHGCTLCARLELGVEKDGQRITDESSTQTSIVRTIQPRRGTPSKKNKNKMKQNTKFFGSEELQPNKDSSKVSSSITATYSHTSISVGQIEYPFPSGLYQRMMEELLHETGDNRRSDTSSITSHGAPALGGSTTSHPNHQFVDSNPNNNHNNGKSTASHIVDQVLLTGPIYGYGRYEPKSPPPSYSSS